MGRIGCRTLVYFSGMEKIISEILSKTDEVFGVSDDPFQIPVTKEAWDKMMSLHPDSILYRSDGADNLMGWLGMVPTTKELMNKFINGEISEREMFNMTEKQNISEALYLGGVVVLPEYRRKGLAKELLKEAIRNFRKINPQIILFYWAFSNEGKKLAEKVSRELHIEILAKKQV